MLRMSVAAEEYLMIGDDIRIIFLGGTGKHIRIMIDAPKEVNIVRSSVLERQFTDPEIRAKLPKYYAEPEHPEKYKKKRVVIAGAADRGRSGGSRSREEEKDSGRRAASGQMKGIQKGIIEAGRQALDD